MSRLLKAGKLLALSPALLAFGVLVILGTMSRWDVPWWGAILILVTAVGGGVLIALAKEPEDAGSAGRITVMRSAPHGLDGDGDATGATEPPSGE